LDIAVAFELQFDYAVYKAEWVSVVNTPKQKGVVASLCRLNKDLASGPSVISMQVLLPMGSKECVSLTTSSNISVPKEALQITTGMH